MTYTVTLWRCTRVSSSGDDACPGFRYVEPGDEPERCDHKTILGHSNKNLREHSCHGRMHRVGDFAFETHEMAAEGQQKGAVDAVHTG